MASRSLLLAAALAACCLAPASASAELTFAPAPGGPHTIVTENTSEVVTGDLNNDGRPDLVVGQRHGQDTHIYLGRADGGFTFAQEIKPDNDSEDDSEQVVIANLDTDGDLDIATAGTELRPYLNNGAGSFAPGTVVDLGAGADRVGGLVAANFDGDADTDLAVTVSDAESNTGAGLVRILANNGSAQFTFPNDEAIGGFPGDLVAGNFDGQNGPDLAYATSAGAEYRIGVLLHAGGLDFTAAPGGTALASQYLPFEAAQLNGGGPDDLVFQSSVKVAFGTGGGAFGAPVTLTDEQPRDIVVGDFTGDGIPDVVTVDDVVRIYAGSSGGTFTLVASITIKQPGEEFYMQGIAGDFDGDGVDDLGIAGEKSMYAFLTRGAEVRRGGGGNGGAGGGSGGGGGGNAPGGSTTTTPAITPPPPRPPAVSGTARTPRINVLARLPSSKTCASRRRFRIRLPQPPAGVKVTQAQVLVNGKRARVVRASRLRAPVDLRGLPKGTVTVTIRVVLADGTVVSGSRRYRTCAPKRTRRG